MKNAREWNGRKWLEVDNVEKKNEQKKMIINIRIEEKSKQTKNQIVKENPYYKCYYYYRISVYIYL